MAIMQEAVVACLGVTDTPGRSAGKPWNNLPDGSLWGGLIRSMRKMVIFAVEPPIENGTNRKISMRLRSEQWFHLDWSYGHEDTRGGRSGTNL